MILTQYILASVQALLQTRTVSYLVDVFVELFGCEVKYFTRVSISCGPVLPALFSDRLIRVVKIDIIWARQDNLRLTRDDDF